MDEPTPIANGDLIKDYTAMKNDYEKIAKELNFKRFEAKFWRYILLGIACIWLYKTKSDFVWLPDLDGSESENGRVQVIYKDWWGLETKRFHPVWLKAAIEGEKNWCIQYPDHSWHVFATVMDESDGYGKSIFYKFPPEK